MAETIERLRRRIGRLGWVPDHPDQRDQIFSAPREIMRKLPRTVDLRGQCPPVYDQGRIGSCTANALAGVVQFDRQKAKQSPDFVPSRLFVYYNERAIEGHVAFDSGAQLRDGIKSIAKVGVCPESQWPYDDTPAESDGGPFPPGSKPATRPSSTCYETAVQFEALNYSRVPQLLSQMKGCLASGFPFAFGFTVYTSFFVDPNADRLDQKTEIPLPGESDRPVGGHAVVAVGYDDGKNRFVVRNSWGSGQGERGYFYMPYAYLTDRSLAADFWVVRTIKD